MKLSLPAESPNVRCFMLTRACVLAGGVMLAGIVWEVEGTKSRVTECAIIWFSMFAATAVVIDLMEAS